MLFNNPCVACLLSGFSVSIIFIVVSLISNSVSLLSMVSRRSYCSHFRDTPIMKERDGERHWRLKVRANGACIHFRLTSTNELSTMFFVLTRRCWGYSNAAFLLSITSDSCSTSSLAWRLSPPQLSFSWTFWVFVCSVFFLFKGKKTPSFGDVLLQPSEKMTRSVWLLPEKNSLMYKLLGSLLVILFHQSAPVRTFSRCLDGKLVASRRDDNRMRRLGLCRMLKCVYRRQLFCVRDWNTTGGGGAGVDLERSPHPFWIGTVGSARRIGVKR